MSEEEALKATDNLDLYRTDMHMARPLAGQPLRPALQASARWHRALARHECDLVTDRQNVKWGALTGEIDLGKNVTAVELNSKRALQVEGAMQDHCAGGYDKEVLEGKSLLYSIRRDGKTLSTIELEIEKGRNGKFAPSIVQNMAEGNTKPGKPAREAGKQLARHLAKLPEKQLASYMEGLQDEREKLRAVDPRDIATRNTGYDPFDRKQLEKSWNALSEYLPKPVRKRGLDAFVDSQEAMIDQGKAARDAHYKQSGWSR